MKSSELTERQFLEDVATHQIHALHDAGIYRHLLFSRPGSSIYHFEVVTYPGFLCYTGDMGSFVFWRLTDMFQFFRSDEHRGRLQINPAYWAEKLQATDRNGGHEEFSEERFVDVINSYRVRWMREAFADNNLDKNQRRDLWESVKREVLDRVGDGQHEAMRAAYEFSWGHRREYRFDDLWDHHFEQWSTRFLWACYAIVWGIEQYDALKAEKAAEAIPCA